MASAGSIEVLLKANGTAEFLSKIQQVAKGLEGIPPPAAAAEGALGSLGKKVIGFAAALGALKFGQHAVEMADSWNETGEKLDRVFGQSSAAVDEFAQNLAKSTGTSASMLREVTAETGLLAAGMSHTQKEQVEMSKSMVQAGVNMGAAWNVDKAAAIHAVTRAVGGHGKELEMMTGIQLKATTEAGRFKEAMEQLSGVAGVAEGEANDLEGAWGKLKNTGAELMRTIGDDLIPIVKEMLKAFDGIAKMDEVKSTLQTIGHLFKTVIVGPVALATATVLDLIAEVVNGFDILRRITGLVMKGTSATYDEWSAVWSDMEKNSKSQGSEAGDYFRGVAKSVYDPEEEPAPRVAEPGVIPPNETRKTNDEREAAKKAAEKRAQEAESAAKKLKQIQDQAMFDLVESLGKLHDESNKVTAAFPGIQDAVIESSNRFEELKLKAARAQVGFDDYAVKQELGAVAAQKYAEELSKIDDPAKFSSAMAEITIAAKKTNTEMDDVQKALAKIRKSYDKEVSMAQGLGGGLSEFASNLMGLLAKKDEKGSSGFDKGLSSVKGILPPEVTEMSSKLFEELTALGPKQMEMIQGLVGKVFEKLPEIFSFGLDVFKDMGSMVKGMGSIISGIGEAVAGIVQTVIQTFMDFLEKGFDFLKKSIGEIFNAVFADSRIQSGMGKGAAAGGAAAAFAFSPVTMALTGGLAPAILTPLAAVGGALFDLTTKTKSYAQFQQLITMGMDQLVVALEPVWRSLLPLGVLLMKTIGAFSIMIGSIMSSEVVGRMLFNVFQDLARVTIQTAAVISDMGYAIQIVVEDLLDMIGKGRRNADEEDAFAAERSTQRRLLLEALSEINGATYEWAMAVAENLTTPVADLKEAAKETGESLTNVPEGFKTALHQFNATTGDMGSGVLMGDDQNREMGKVFNIERVDVHSDSAEALAESLEIAAERSSQQQMGTTQTRDGLNKGI